VTSIFFDFTLPNAATWFYLSLILCVALFFQFHRVLSLRNLDLLALFLFAPGFLVLEESVRWEKLGDGRAPSASRYVGYGLLLGATLYWFVRCLSDLATDRRPTPMPNLSQAGLIWFTSALAVILAGAAFLRPSETERPVGKPPAALNAVQDQATAVMAQTGTPAASDPVSARWWVESTTALLCHVAVVLGLIFLGWKQFGSAAVGTACGALYLLLPYTAFHLVQIHHVWPAAVILWAVFFYRRPTVSGLLLGLAAGTAFFPVLLLPAWIHFYRRHGLGRFVLGFGGAAAVGMILTISILAATGRFPAGFWSALHLADWQPWRTPTAESIWTGAHWAYRIPVFILYAGYVFTLVIWPPVKNLGHLIAMSAGILLGIQFWFADRGGLYVLWYQPLLILMVMRTNLVEHVAVAPGPILRAWPKLGAGAAPERVTTTAAAEKPGTA